MLDIILFIVQCIGVVSFAITGTIIAIQKKTDFIGALAFALLTCFGGGMLRDICSAQIPSVFRKNIYLIPAVLGSALYTLTYDHWNPLVSMLLSIALIIVIRLLAYFFKWNLPVHTDR